MDKIQIKFMDMRYLNTSPSQPFVFFFFKAIPNLTHPLTHSTYQHKNNNILIQPFPYWLDLIATPPRAKISSPLQLWVRYYFQNLANHTPWLTPKDTSMNTERIASFELHSSNGLAMHLSYDSIKAHKFSTIFIT